MNSGTKNHRNVFLWAIFGIEKVGTASGNHADSEDIKVFIQLPGDSFLIFLPNPSQTPTQKLNNGFSIFIYQEIGRSLVSYEMIFEALQFELFRYKFYWLSFKILKIPEFNLNITYIVSKYKLVYLVKTRHTFHIWNRLTSLANTIRLNWRRELKPQLNSKHTNQDRHRQSSTAQIQFNEEHFIGQNHYWISRLTTVF